MSIPTSQKKSIAGSYTDVKKLYESANCIIFRGKEPKDGHSVILKVPRKPEGTKAERILYEFEIRQQIRSEFVVKFLELRVDAEYGYILVEEDDNAKCLAECIPSNGYELMTSLRIAIQLAKGLKDIHRDKVIHRDIRPSNIIIQPESDKVKYIDLGSSLSLKQIKLTINRYISEGTLAYTSPEQFGRIHRRIDYCTDFYSMGVTLYQLMCGKLPFTSNNVRELMRSHTTEQPIALHEIKPSIPEPISDIVMKLLQKDPEDRYQSAYGLLIDLKRCWEDLTERGYIIPFTLAQHDLAEHFSLPQKLYGRESELNQMKKVFDIAREGQPQVCVIVGGAGTGKSVLVHEIRPHVINHRGNFLVGKFEQMDRGMAYRAITQAFQGGIKTVLAMGEGEIMRWKEILIDSLGVHGQLLIDVIPELELIIGNQPAVPILDTAQTKNRFHLVFQNFICSLAQPSHPLVLFLDDWQWADEASLNLMESILKNPQTKCLLLLGAYRDNEVDASHPAILTLETLKKAKINVHTLRLDSLSLSSVNQWLADAFHASLESTNPLALLTYQKTQGSPFFIKIFLEAMHEKQLLTLDERGWQWDLPKINQHPATDNVVEFMTHQILQLQSSTQTTLKFASCIGHQFTLSTLQLIMQTTQEPLLSNLQPVIANGLLLQVDNSFKFVHDRIQETIYGLIPTEKRLELHLMIGRLLQSKLPPEPNSETLFEVVDHLNQGRILITDQNELLSLAELNLAAGNKAKQNIAYSAALVYLQTATNSLNHLDIWQNHFSFAWTLYKELADVEYWSGHFKQSAKTIDWLLSHARTVLDKVEVYNLRIIHQTSKTDYAEAIKTGFQALGLLNIDLHSKDFQSLLDIDLKQTKEALQNKTMDELLNAPKMKRLDIKMTMKLLCHMAPSTYLLNNQTLHDLLITKMVNLTLHYGNTEESARGYVTYAAVLVMTWGDIELGYELSLMAMNLCNQFQNLTIQCQTYFLYVGFIHHWRKPLRQMHKYMERVEKLGLISGEFQFLSYLSGQKAFCFFCDGTLLTDMDSKLNQLLMTSYNCSNQVVIAMIHAVRLVVLNLMGQTRTASDFHDAIQSDIDYRSNWEKNRIYLALCANLILRARALYLHGFAEQALEAILSSTKYLISLRGFIAESKYSQYHSLILTALYSNVDEDTQRKYWQQLEDNQRQQAIWVEHCPENFKHHYLLVAAEMARIKGKDSTAAEQYDQAIRSALEQGFIHDQALACELAAKYWLGKKKPLGAQSYLYYAYIGYLNWGAKRKAELLCNQYEKLLKPVLSTGISNFFPFSEINVSASSLALVDMAHVLKSSQTVDVEAVFNQLTTLGQDWDAVKDELLMGVLKYNNQKKEIALKHMKALVEYRDLLDYGVYRRAVESIFSPKHYKIIAQLQQEPQQPSINEGNYCFKSGQYQFNVFSDSQPQLPCQIIINAPGSRTLTSDIDTSIYVRGANNLDLSFADSNIANRGPDYDGRVRNQVISRFYSLSEDLHHMSSSENRDSNAYADMATDDEKEYPKFNFTESSNPTIHGKPFLQDKQFYAHHKLTKHLQEQAASLVPIWQSVRHDEWEIFKIDVMEKLHTALIFFYGQDKKRIKHYFKAAKSDIEQILVNVETFCQVTEQEIIDKIKFLKKERAEYWASSPLSNSPERLAADIMTSAKNLLYVDYLEKTTDVSNEIIKLKRKIFELVSQLADLYQERDKAKQQLIDSIGKEVTEELKGQHVILAEQTKELEIQLQNSLRERADKLIEKQALRIKAHIFANEAYVNRSAVYHVVKGLQHKEHVRISKQTAMGSAVQQIGFRFLHSEKLRHEKKSEGEIAYLNAKYGCRVFDLIFNNGEDPAQEVPYSDNDIESLVKGEIILKILYCLKTPEIQANSHCFFSREEYHLLNSEMKLLTQVKQANILDAEKPTKALKIVKRRMQVIDPLSYSLEQKITEEDVQAFAKTTERTLFKSIAIKIIVAVYVAKLEYNKGYLWGNVNANPLTSLYVNSDEIKLTEAGKIMGLHHVENSRIDMKKNHPS